MNSVVKLLSVIVAFTLLSSCSPPGIDIAVEKIGDRILLHLSQDRGLGLILGRQVPCVSEIELHEPGSYGPSKAAWFIHTKDEVQCLDLPSVMIGEVPSGWQETVRLSAKKGKVYTIVVYGIGLGETNVRF